MAAEADREAGDQEIADQHLHHDRADRRHG